MKRKHLFIIGTTCTLLLAGASVQAAGVHARGHHQRSSDKQDEKRNAELVAKITKKLANRHPDQIREGYELLRKAGPDAKDAVPAANARLRRGLSPALVRVALSALGAAKQSSSSVVIAAYLHHRSPSLRVEAAKALALTGGAAARRALVRGLSDARPRVREQAALSLGVVGSASDVPWLLKALDHKVNAAAQAIGAVCDKRGGELFFRRMASQSFEVMAGGLRPMLLRVNSPDLDALRVRIIARVQSLKTHEAYEFLEDVQKSWPEGGSSDVKTKLDEAIKSSSSAHGVSE